MSELCVTSASDVRRARVVGELDTHTHDLRKRLRARINIYLSFGISMDAIPADAESSLSRHLVRPTRCLREKSVRIEKTWGCERRETCADVRCEDARGVTCEDARFAK